MKIEDAEVIVVLAACLHDIGISAHRDDHEKYSLFLAYPKARELLNGIYKEPALTTIASEVMHAIVSHNAKEDCLTIEDYVEILAKIEGETERRLIEIYKF